MKKILTVITAAFIIQYTVYGQHDQVRPPAIGVSFYVNDFVSASRIRSTSLVTVLANKQMAKLREMDPGFSISYFKGIRNHVDYSATLSGGFLRYPMPNKSFFTDRLLLELSGNVLLKMTTERYWVQPYLTLGLAAHKYMNYYGATMPLGVGVKFNVFDEAHLFVHSNYRVPITTETANYHFQHSVGVAAPLRKKPDAPKVSDKDNDGVPDNIDACPDVPGPAATQGCPDRDGDGILDKDDNCPDVKGVAKYKGCPVPDTDKDGINDEEDKCPTVPGIARYQGCPIPDTDGDGLNDEKDDCVDKPGPASNKGCPEIPKEILKRVEFAAKNILFATGTAKLLSKSFKGLNDVARIMNENPDMKLSIEGHTDNIGKDDYNQRLSENRAAAVRNYLISKGVSEDRITSQGFGETRPIATNNTPAGRQQNRRVELKLSYYSKIIQ
ncbi:MAG: OmpA family protein [Chitinophagaceae bacterium]|nr:OmpA family protein [Chitinophagaceae bacterium]